MIKNVIKGFLVQSLRTQENKGNYGSQRTVTVSNYCVFILIETTDTKNQISLDKQIMIQEKEYSIRPI